LNAVVLLFNPDHPNLPLDHCSPLGIDHLVHHLIHDYLDQDLVRLELDHFRKFHEVDYLDLVDLHHQSPFFIEHHMRLPHHLQDHD
jgi:hypothetical protein